MQLFTKQKQKNRETAAKLEFCLSNPRALSTDRKLGLVEPKFSKKPHKTVNEINMNYFIYTSLNCL